MANCYPFVMVAMDRIRVLWSGGPGGAGVSTLYADPASTSALADVRAFFAVAFDEISDDITVTFPNVGDQVESTTGQITGSWSRAAAASVTGGGTSSWTAGVGFRAVYETGSIIGGRRVRGSTFFTGLGIVGYQADGTINNTFRAAVETAGNASLTSGNIWVWSRPGTAGGPGVSSVSSVRVPDKVSWLRTRRE